MTVQGWPGLYLGLALTVLLVNLAWMMIFGPALAQRYLPDLEPSTLIGVTASAGATVTAFGYILDPGLLLPVGTSLFTLGWLSALSDARIQRLPNAVTATMGLEVAAVLLLLSSFELVDQRTWLNALGGAALWSIVIGLGWKLGHMGMGDLKLAPVLGFMLGSGSAAEAAVGLLLAFLLAGLHGVATLFEQGRSGRIPFGPAMILAAMATWVLRVLLGPLSLALLSA